VWRTGGTAASTRRLASLPDYVFSAHPSARRLLFLSGHQLWASDGSVAGTAPIFGPPADPGLEVHVFLSTAGGKVYFLARAGAQSETLWVSDGTRRGTGIVSPALSSDSPGSATVGARIFIVASDGVHGSELWSSRGTARTTALVADLCPGSCSAFPEPDAVFLVAAGGRVFFQAEDPVAGRELFVSDGTAAGTRRVLELCPGACGSPAGLSPAGGEVYFYGQDPTHGVELWASDGTPGGTRRLSDFNLAEPFDTNFPLPAPSLAILGNRVITLGFDTESGFEPWVFDRAGGGGQRLADIF
jgi:ELWxxDGT repeat protein